MNQPRLKSSLVRNRGFIGAGQVFTPPLAGWAAATVGDEKGGCAPVETGHGTG